MTEPLRRPGVTRIALQGLQLRCGLQSASASGAAAAAQPGLQEEEWGDHQPVRYLQARLLIRRQCKSLRRWPPLSRLLRSA